MNLKFFKKEKSFKKESSRLNLVLYWKLAILFMLVTTLGSLFFGYYLFMQTNKDPVVPVGVASGKVETVSKDKIDKVLEYFTLRKQKSDQILATPAPFVDPSL
jgi:hypothetical protein